MIGRISTAGFYQQGLTALLQRQASLAKTQQQLATGLRLTRAADDPLAAGSAVSIDRSIAQLERYGKNADALSNRLNLQEGALTEAGDIMLRLRELAVQANSSVLSPTDKQAIALEVEQLRESMLGIANTADGSGRYLFGGTQDDNPPFVAGSGGVAYVGDQTQRQIDVAPGLALDDVEPGSEVFFRIPTGDGRVSASFGAGNTGTGRIMGFGLMDAAAWDGDTYTVSFTAPDAYEIRDSGGAVVGTGAYVPGDAIEFAGLQLRIEGAPAVGDGFSVGASGRRDIFATIDALTAALNAPSTTPTERAAQQNALAVSLADISQAQDHFIETRAGGGARLAAIDDATDLREAQALTLKETVSGLRDLDYAEASSRFAQELTALEAAQASFVQVQQLSLFQMLR